MRVLSKRDWGCDGFARVDGGGQGAYARSWGQIDAFMIHWEGVGSYLRDDPVQAMRAVHRSHKHVEGGSWGGVGYNWAVFGDGTVAEGRGWLLTAVACPDWNTRAVHVQAHMGTSDVRPTAAMKASVKALYEEACRLSGRRLRVMGHRDGYATECPGAELYAWLRAGMPGPSASVGSNDVEDDVAVADLMVNPFAEWLRQVLLIQPPLPGAGMTRDQALHATYLNSVTIAGQVEMLVKAISAGGTGGGGVSAEVLKEIRALGDRNAAEFRKALEGMRMEVALKATPEVPVPAGPAPQG